MIIFSAPKTDQYLWARFSFVAKLKRTWYFLCEFVTGIARHKLTPCPLFVQ